MTEYTSHLEGRRDLAECTKQRAREALAHLFRYINKRKGRTPGHVAHGYQKYIDHLMDLGFSPGTIRLYSRYAVSWLRERGHEAARHNRPRYGRRTDKGRPLDNGAVRSLMARASGHWLEVACYLCLYAGLRIGEAQALLWSDVDLDARLLYITGGKSKDHRAIPLCHRLHEFLTRWRATYPNATRVVERPKGGVTDITRGLGRLGVDGGWHSLRRTFATSLVEAGVHMSKIATLMGHQSVATTQRYVYGEVTAEDLTKALDW